MADFTLPIVNSVDDLKSSNRADSEKLRSTIKLGLFDVVKSVNRIGSIRSPAGSDQAAADRMVMPEQGPAEANIYDKLSTFFEFQTGQGAKKLVEAEQRVAASELEVAEAQKQAAAKVAAAYKITAQATEQQAQAQENFTATYESSMQQQARIGSAQFSLFRAMADSFTSMKELLSGIQEILSSESNRQTDADLRHIWLTEQMLDIWRGSPGDLEYQAKKEMFRLRQEQYSDEMQNINFRQQQLFNATDPALQDLEEELIKFLNMNTRKQAETTEAVEELKNELDKNDEQQLGFFERIFGSRGMFFDSFGSLRKSQEDLNKTMGKMVKNQEDQIAESGGGGIGGALATSMLLLRSPLLWKAAFLGIAAYGGYKIAQGVDQGWEIATKPEEEWSPETRAEWEKMQKERKEETRNNMRRMGIDISDEEDPDSPVNRSKFFWGQMYDYVPDWMKTTEENQNDPGILDAGKEFWNKIIGSGEEAARSATSGEADIDYAVPVQVVNTTPRTLETAADRVGAEVNARSTEAAAASNKPVVVSAGGGSQDNSTTVNNTNNGSTIMTPASPSAKNRQSSSGGGMFARDLMLAP